MENIDLPSKFESKSVGKNQSIISIEPCYPGYGTTIGNSLRRVLLSSLPGVAAYTIKIKGVSHEFSTVPGIKEDIVEMILNIKSLRFKLHGTEETRIMLKTKGEKEVKAKDFKLTSEIEIVNPELHIATLTEKNAELELEIFVKTGRGYLPIENIDNKKLEIDAIAIDAIFTPIKNVNFEVESVRVGQMTNYDRLNIGITTDGSITPEEALLAASEILVDHFQVISKNFTKSEKKVEKKKGETDEKKKKDEEESEPKTKRKKGKAKKE